MIIFIYWPEVSDWSVHWSDIIAENNAVRTKWTKTNKFQLVMFEKQIKFKLIRSKKNLIKTKSLCMHIDQQKLCLIRELNFWIVCDRAKVPKSPLMTSSYKHRKVSKSQERHITSNNHYGLIDFRKRLERVGIFLKNKDAKICKCQNEFLGSRSGNSSEPKGTRECQKWMRSNQTRNGMPTLDKWN